MSLIDEILEASRLRLKARKLKRPFPELRAMVRDMPRASVSFKDALSRSAFSIIAEIKHRSPSSGPMNEANVQAALGLYGRCPSVSAISILTNEDHFDGSLDHLKKARRVVTKPLLRKDFIVDDYQVWEARAFGADAILLMAGLQPDKGRLRGLYDTAVGLGMDALFEIGMSRAPIEEQASMIPPTASIVGINSRRFTSSRFAITARAGRLLGKEMTTSLSLHHELFSKIPSGKLAVAESGISVPGELGELSDTGYRAALIGTALLKNGVSVESVLDSFDRYLRDRAPERAASARLIPGVA